MKKQIGLMTLSLMLVSPALAGGAGAPVKAQPTACKSIAQIVTGDPQFSTLATAVDAAGLTSVLSGQGSYTVFAPNNAAFAKVPSDTLAGLLNDSEALKGLILYHVVGEKATAAQIRGVKGGTTMQGADITISVSGNKLMVNNATVIKGDVMACNGIVHVIDTVLLPPAPEAEAPAPAPAPEAAPAPAPEPAPAAAAPAPVAAPIVIPALPLSGATVTQTTTQQTTTVTTTDATATTDTSAADTAVSTTVYDVIADDERFSVLRDLISDAELTETLTTGEYTIFAPTDEAFDAIPEEILAAIRSDPAALKAVLTYHVVDHKVSTADIEGGAEIKTVEGMPLDLGSATLGTVVESSNGIVYPIDVVLMPPDFKVPDVKVIAADTTPTPPNITTLVVTDARFSTLRDLLVTAGLADALTTGDFTVFAPTNDAFAKVDAATLDGLKKDKAKLKAVLSYHVLTGRPDAAALVAAPLKTLEGSDLVIKQDGTALMVGNAKSDGTAVATGNGNVYVIDTVLIPADLK